MKKREAKREIDLLSSVSSVPSREISFLTDKIIEYSVEYNDLMEEYKKGDRTTKFLFILLGNNDRSVYQLIPLFCRHFGIALYKIEDKLRINDRVPLFIRVKEGDQIIEKLEKVIEKLKDL